MGDKEAAIIKCGSLQKEIEQLRVEAIRRVDQLHNLPPQYLKTLEWNLRKDIQEVEKAMRAQDQQLWVSNNRLMDAVGLGLGSALGAPTSQQGGNMNDWSSQLSLNLQPLYSPMAQQ